MPPLRKTGVRKLLKTVRGKEHAGPQDHEEEEAAPPPTATATSNKKSRTLTEDEINADPVSSDEFEEEEAQPSAKTPLPLPSRANKTSINPRGSKKAKRQTAKSMSVPRLGSFNEGQEIKRKIHAAEDEGKENAQEDSSSSTGKRPWEGEFGWGSQSSTATKKQKTPAARTYGSSNKPGVSNIHASRPTNGKNGAAYVKEVQTTLAAYSVIKPSSSIVKPSSSPDDSDTSSSTSDDDGDFQSKFRKTAKRRINKSSKLSTTDSKPPSPPPKPRPNLLASLGVYKQPESSPPDDSYETPATSQDPHALHNLMQEVENLPDQEALLNSSCPLCHEPVDPEHSQTFWKYNKKSLRNQTKFCNEHGRRTAQIEYEARGLPKIAWRDLPYRIRKLRPRLEKVLRNESGFESKYRTQNAAKLVSGQAAVYRPSKNKRIQKMEDIKDVEDDVELTLHDGSSSTGYYGPRGHRLMMEVLTADLGDVFREVAVLDPVVGKSGFAEYIERVLVPELTVMLVMDDLHVGESRAEEVIEKSTQLGAILHEDVDDVVVVLSDEDEEREMLDLDDDEKYREFSD